MNYHEDMKDYFFDTHFHVMTLDHPNFINLLGSFQNGLMDYVNSGALSPSYILTDENRKGKILYSVMNTLGAFEQPIDKTFAMMESDLRGEFLREGFLYGPAYIKDGSFTFRGHKYDKIGMIPQLMDFSRDQSEYDKVYYRRTQLERINQYAMDTIRAIERYHKEHPDGLFEFFPFIGINPAVHTKRFVTGLLEKYVNTGHRRSLAGGKKIFYGVKVYPPLGMNPWPEGEKEEMEKVRTIYEFCQTYQIPITTHCDNQGFRGITAKQLVEFTSPKTWAKVLAEYPDLIIDFAHFGYEYGLASDVKAMVPVTLPMKGDWFDEIIRLMRQYKGVYADLSYTGCMPEFYKSLLMMLGSLKGGEQDNIVSRIIFGTDFSVNLVKVQSYLEYYHIFDRCPFTDEQIHRISSDNPLKFLGLLD